jgi:hypothetical protein
VLNTSDFAAAEQARCRAVGSGTLIELGAAAAINSTAREYNAELALDSCIALWTSGGTYKRCPGGPSFVAAATNFDHAVSTADCSSSVSTSCESGMTPYLDRSSWNVTGLDGCRLKGHIFYLWFSAMHLSAVLAPHNRY